MPEWSQGNPHPEKGSIKSPRVASDFRTVTKCCPPQTPQTSDLRLVQHLFEVCTRTWSPRSRLRLDPQKTHNYLATSSIPALAPTFPWATHLADRQGRFRLLAFDFDSSRHGPDVATTDADRLCSVLDQLGVPHLRTTSGPSGGQHVWLRLAHQGAAADPVRQLAHALRQHYPSLDPSALNNPATGAVRPPGSPHRHGGRSLPHLRGPALDDTLARMTVGAPPDVVQWLLARHPHAHPPEHKHRRAVRIIEDPAGPRLDRPRRHLTARTQSLLATDPPPGSDRSALAHSILLGMATSGQTLSDVEAVLASAPGLIRLREDRDRGRDDTARQWRRAVETAAQFTPVVLDKHESIDDELVQIEAAVTAAPARWARPGGASDERILHALIVLARTARTRTLDIDVRRLSQAAGIDASTVSRRLRVLAAEGWVSRIRPGVGTRSATWKLNLPSSAATQGEPAPGSTSGLSSTLLAHHTHDVWLNYSGLGAVAARIHWTVHRFWKTISSACGRKSLSTLVSELTGYTTKTVAKTLRTLHKWRLLPPLPTSSIENRMNDVASTLGVRGATARKAYRHLVDRELHRWWLEELEWRTRRGKKRGVPATTPNNLTLPIEASARMRYGRFPTTSKGGADYRSARAIIAELLTETISSQAA